MSYFWGNMVTSNSRWPQNAIYVTEGDLDLLILLSLLLSSGIKALPTILVYGILGNNLRASYMVSKHSLSELQLCAIWTICKTWFYLSKINKLKLSFTEIIIPLLFTIAQSFHLESSLLWTALTTNQHTHKISKRSINKWQ